MKINILFLMVSVLIGCGNGHKNLSISESPSSETEGQPTSTSILPRPSAMRVDVYDFIKNYNRVNDADKNAFITNVKNYKMHEFPKSLKSDDDFLKELLNIIHTAIPEQLYAIIMDFNGKNFIKEKEDAIIAISKILRSLKTNTEKEQEIRHFLKSKLNLAGLDKKVIAFKWPTPARPEEDLARQIYDVIFSNNGASRTEKIAMYSYFDPIGLAILLAIEKDHKALRDKNIRSHIQSVGNYKEIADKIIKIFDSTAT